MKKTILRSELVNSFYNEDKMNIHFWLARMEKYNKDAVYQACLNAGTTKEIAAHIANEIDKYVDNRIKMSEVRPLIFSLLEQYDPAAARRFRGKELYVRTSRFTYEYFDRKKIKESLLKETEISEEAAEMITSEVEAFLKNAQYDVISSSLIRELVNARLLQHGLDKIRMQYTRIGMPVYDVTALINQGSKENANLQYNPETVHKLVADSILKEYTLVKLLPKNLSHAHIRGEIHVHDLDYFAMRPFCFSHDIRFFLKRGYVSDGQGVHTAVAGPAKHPEVAILHAAKFLASAQTNCAGGQGYNWFNILFSPFLRDLPYERIKQLAQMFIYEMSQMYVARGGQTVFSSIDIEPEIPKVLMDVPAVLPGGQVRDGVTYADFQDETEKFFRAIIEVYTNGDSLGKPFHFPKCEVKVSPELLEKYSEDYLAVSRLAAKFGTPYFFVQQPYMPEYSCYQCCSYLMDLSDQNSNSDLYNGSVRGGALQVVTLNLPRIAYEARGSDDRFFEILRQRMELMREVMYIKNNIIKKRLAQGLLPFLAQKVNENELYLNPDKMSYELGMVGLNEALKAHLGYELHESKDAWTFGMKVIKTMCDIAKEFNKENKIGGHFVVSRTPAESCSHRLARIDLREFDGKAIVQGDRRTGAVYYTNSTHVRPSADIGLWDRIRIESAFHPLLVGGALMHIWLGEAFPSVEALHEMNKKIINNTLTAYYAYTKDLTLCKKCNFVHGEAVRTCPKCGASDVEIYSRITGYYQNISSWNEGKRAEFLDRKRYKVLN